MKKLLLTTALLAVFAFGANAQQEQGDIRVGLGLAAGTRAGIDDTNGEAKLGLGLNVGAEYLFTDAISIAPSYTSFFKTEIGGADFSYSSFNIDLRYYFGESGIYGLAGFGSVRAKAEGGGLTVTESEGGLNIGAGAMLPLSDALYFNGQVKYNTVQIEDVDGESGQLVLNIGVAYSF